MYVQITKAEGYIDTSAGRYHARLVIDPDESDIAQSTVKLPDGTEMKFTIPFYGLTTAAITTAIKHTIENPAKGRV